MNRMDKIEYIKNHIDDVDHKDILDFIHACVKAYINKEWEKDKK